MPSPVTKATAPERVLTATRGPDSRQQEGILKSYTVGVVRWYITDWKYGARSALPFVALPEEERNTHFGLHIEEAAALLDLPILLIDSEVYGYLPSPPQHPQEDYPRWAHDWCQVFGATHQDDGGY